MGGIFVAAGLVTVGAFVVTGMQVRRSYPGDERDAVVNSFWFLAGSAVLLLALWMQAGPFSVPGFLPWLALGVSGVLTSIGSVRARRLKTARRHLLLADRADADTVADRIDVLEASGALDRGPPLRWRVVLLGGKLIGAGLLAWVAYTLRSPTLEILVGTMAGLHLIWAGADAYGIAQVRTRQLELDEQVDLLLNAPKDGGV